jgi:hypothetical protein
MPSMRPLTRMNKAEARPSRRPPASEAQGVKWVQSMVMDGLQGFGVSRVDTELFVQHLDHGQRLGLVSA